MSRRPGVLARATIVAVLVLRAAAGAPAAAQDAHPDVRLFLQAGSASEAQAALALRQIAARWRNGYAGMVWDLAYLRRPPGRGFLRFFTLVNFLEQQTGEAFGPDLSRWQRWIWDAPYEPHPEYGYFKGQWYGQIDPRFEAFFPRGVPSSIRLDEVEWGGVGVNGIPPLEYPNQVDADEADYLADDHIVFGIALNGESRAYPKRILAWHEMALDRLGQVELTIVYCTLCGTVIPFDSVVDGRQLTFGTSGLLYRSNKLMFDAETRSLWNTFEGVPVVGTLVESGLRLTPRAVVTTTWGEWRRRHPATTVLSLETGHRRDYSEGAAYRQYFGTDDLMFEVSRTDDRLPNKAEVLVLRSSVPARAGRRPAPLAITARFLRRHRVFHHRFDGRNLVVVTSAAGANRVYDAREVRFTRHLDDDHLVDAAGRRWRVAEDALVLEGAAAAPLERVAAHRAFWFGWYAQFPDTALID